MSSLTVQEAQANLSELIHNLKPGDEVVITDNDEPGGEAGCRRAATSRASASRHASRDGDVHGAGLRCSAG